MKNYQCKRCNTVIQSTSYPNSTGCPAGTSHNWVSLGETGTKTYQCKRCGIVLLSKDMPYGYACQNGSSHSWNKL